jgi:ribonuclease J
MEGTHLGSSKSRGLSEVDLEEDLVRRARATPGLVLASFSPLNVDRLISYYKTALRTGRTFVVDPYAAFVLHLVAGQCKVPRPGGKSGIKVVFPGPGHAARNPPERVVAPFRRARIALDEVLSAPGKHLMIYRERVFRDDMGGKLPGDTLVLYSYWAGYLKQDRGLEFRKRLEGAGATIELAHASGHIHPEDLSGFVRGINPKVLIPVHTFHPKQFKTFWPEVWLPRDGECLGL